MHEWGVRAWGRCSLHEWGVRVWGEVFPAPVASDQPLLVPTWSQTWLIFNPHLPQDKQYKENILWSLGRTDVTAPMAMGQPSTGMWRGRVAQASAPPTPPPDAESALVRCSLPGFRKRGFVPKVLYPEISQTRPAPQTARHVPN